MQVKNEIIIVEDDLDDQELIQLILNQLNIEHDVRFFETGDKAFDYVSDEHVIPFMIFSDINMPGMNGFQLRDKIHAHDGLRSKCVPFIFLTTASEAKFIWEAYSKNAQGFFIKPSSLVEWKELFRVTIDYWNRSKKPLLERGD